MKTQLELKFVLLILFSTKSIVRCRLAMSSRSTDILSCYKYFTPYSNISLLDLVCLEEKIINSDQRLLLVRNCFCSNEALIEILKARSGSFLRISPSQAGKHVLTRSLSGGKVRRCAVEVISPLSRALLGENIMLLLYSV